METSAEESTRLLMLTQSVLRNPHVRIASSPLTQARKTTASS